MNESIKAQLVEVNKFLGKVGQETEEPLNSAVKSMLSRQGKMLRPTIFLLTNELSEKPHDAAVEVAAGIELLHAASLVHDDIIDKADLRRGKPAIHKEFDSDTALLVGDYLFAEALRILNEHGGKEAGSKGAVTFRDMVRAQTLELALRHNPSPSLDLLETVVNGKTVALFVLAGSLGGSKYQETIVSSLSKLGMAFQIADDLEDLVGDPKTGVLGEDMAEATPTIPVHIVMEQIGEEGRSSIRAAYLSDADTESKKIATSAIISSGTLKSVNETVQKKIQEALVNLESLPATEARNSMEELAQKVATKASEFVKRFE